MDEKRNKTHSNVRNEIEEYKEFEHPELVEDATQYGEFVSTYFAWIPLPTQKEKAEKMANMTITKEENK